MTEQFLSDELLSSEEKSHYEECKEYYRITNQPLVSIANEIYDRTTKLMKQSIKFGIDEDCKKFNLHEFMRQFCNKMSLPMNQIRVNKIQSGSAILEVVIDNKFESKDKKIRIQTMTEKLTPKMLQELAEMKIFFMFMGPISSLNKMQTLV